MSSADERRHLTYLRAAGAAIEADHARLGRQGWLLDPTAQAATAFRLLTVGESSKHLSPELKGRHDLPWREMIRVRNALAHEHLDIDPLIVWDVASRAAPELAAAARRELACAPRQERGPSPGGGLGLGG